MISTLADWAQQRGDSQTAIADYQRVLRQEADNGDARLGLAEVYLAEGDKPAARAQVMQLKGAETESDEHAAAGGAGASWPWRYR